MAIWVRKTEGQPRRKHGCLWAAIIAVVIYAVTMVAIGTLVGGSMNSSAVTKINHPSVYCLELKGTLVEQAPQQDPWMDVLMQMPMAGERNEEVGLDQILSSIQLAKTNDKILGIYLKGGELVLAPASAKAIRDALIDYKTSGKWLIAYADSYSQLNYYIASVADRIYLNEVGMLDWKGLCASKMYYTRLLNKLGVEMQILKVGTFKSAVEPFFRTSMSEADKMQTQVYINGIWDEIVDAVAVSRDVPNEQLRTYADEYMAFQSAEKAVTYGLVDSLVYSQAMKTILEQQTGMEDVKLLSTTKMASVKRLPSMAKQQVAVVYMDGQIYDEGKEGISAKEMIKTLTKVQKNKDVAAVVLRVNSPGGSANASEQIWHAVRLIQEQGIPVVVSMGDYAASGGYYISCEANYIYAEPTTLTGSIGIFGTIPNCKELREKVGLDVDEVHTSTHSAMEMNMVLKGMDDSERQLMQAYIERGYDLFTSRCAEGRHMSQTAIKRIGEGRVWLGKDALAIGLVDEMGNINDAMTKAAELAHIDAYQAVYYPERKDPWEEILDLLDSSTEEEKLLARVRTFVREPRIMALAPIVTIQ